MAHPNARLAPAGRKILVDRITAGMPVAHVAEMMHCTIGDVRDKVHRKDLKAMRWGHQFRFFRDEVIATLLAGSGEDVDPDDRDQP